MTYLKPLVAEDKKLLQNYYNEVRAELDAILGYWMKHTYDTMNGGFIGRINEDNIPFANAPKGAVLNARILWAFSEAYKVTKDPDHLHLARIAFNYLSVAFIDKEHGGLYWTVNANGQPLDTKKQIYALAFAIYGCSAFYEVSHTEAAKTTAIELYRQIEQHSFDAKNSGYLEAFTRDWEPIADLRLSDKDANEKKTMNTHLHVLEAYTTLYRIWPEEQLNIQIKNLLSDFTNHIVAAESGHLVLFFDEQWNRRSTSISYGHDIEAAWLLLEAAEVTGDQALIDNIKKLSVKISTAATEGLDADGGLWYEYEPANNHFIKEKHWWVQAEAMVGLFNHWQLTNDKTYLEKSIHSWQYVKANIKDNQHGEWFWGRNEDGTIMKGQDKIGIWKCPYHNSRTCIELMKRIGTLIV